MPVHHISKGLDLPINGTPVQEIHEGPQVDRVAILAADFVGMKPRMLCQEGDEVKRGQALFEDRKAPGALHTAPGAGRVVAIHRGARRALISVVIELGAADQGDEQVSFSAYTGAPVGSLSGEQVAALLQESGLWTTLRTRPFSQTPVPGTAPRAIFVTAIDTRPHAPSVDVVMKGRDEDFQRGLEALTKLSPKVWLCKAAGAAVSSRVSGVTTEEFSGRHPAGLVGTHIHLLDPVNRQKTVWHVGYQDVLAMGRLFGTGRLDVSRVVSVAGPPVQGPCLLRTRQGAALAPLVAGKLPAGEHRVISGDVLSGRAAMGEVEGFLGRYDMQVSVLREDRDREFVGWLLPGANKFSTVWAYLGGFLPGKRFDFTTSTHGEHRDMVPIGMYERVMPLDILPTFLLRALLTRDLERAEKLGALELDPEDLGLCTFVCPGKQDYGVELRATLDTILKEG